MRGAVTFCLLISLFSYPGMAQWQLVHSGGGKNLVDGCFISDSVGIAISSNGVVYRTTNQGSAWSQQASLSGTFTCLARAGSNTLYAGGNAIYKSTDEGISWALVTQLEKTITDLIFFGDQYGFSIVPGTYECFWNDWYYYYDDYAVYQSTDYGSSWRQDFGAIEHTSRFQQINDSIAYIPGGFYQIVAHCSGPWLNCSRRTTNSGGNWTICHQPEGGNSVYSFFCPDTGYFISPWNNYAIFKTEDGAASLDQFYTELPSDPVSQCLFLNSIDGYLLTGYDILVTASNGFCWSEDHSSTEPLNCMLRGPSNLLFCLGTNGTILRKQYSESTHTDTVYRVWLNKNAVDFGYVPVDSIYFKQLSLKNTGNIALDLTLQSSDQFRISFVDSAFTTTLSVFLEPFQDTVINIRFAPSLEQQVRDTLVITADSLEPRRIPISGFGFKGLTGSISIDTLVCTDTLRIGGDVVVQEGACLSICPGVYVRFLGEYRLEVKGRLKALGDSLHLIRFEAPNGSSYWNGIRIDHSGYNDTTIIRYCLFQPRCKWHNIEISNGLAVVENCSLSTSTLGMPAIQISGYQARAIIQRNIFSDTHAPAISCDYCDTTYVTDNSIYKNNRGITFSTSAGLIITGNQIYQNLSEGIYGSGKATIRNNRIYGNGGGIYFSGDGFTIEKNEIYNNTSSSAGGIFAGVGQGGCFILQNLIFNNTRYYGDGGGIVLAPDDDNDSPAYVIGNTICNNQVYHTSQGSELYATTNTSSGLSVQIINNILYSCSGLNKNLELFPQVQYTIRNNCINQTNVPGENNLNANPEFAFPTDFTGSFSGLGYTNWTLTGFSPCINAGDPGQNGVELPTDLLGNPRVYGDRIDIGAYEYQWPYSVPEAEGNKYCVIYPNPTTGLLFIRLADAGPAEIVVYDVYARKVLEQVIQGMGILDLGGLGPAIYFYTVSNQKGQEISGKIILQ